MVEIKAIIQLENVHLPQVKNYLEANFWRNESSI